MENQTPSIYQVDPRKRPTLASIIPAFSDEPEPKPEHSLMVVGEVDDRVLATITAERVWCVSNFWCDESLRGSGVAEAIAREIASLNHEGLTEMLCTTSPHVEVLAYRFGFVPVKGTMFRR